MLKLAAAGMLAAASATGPTITGQDVVTWAISQGPLGILSLALAYAWRQERNRADAERVRANALVDAFIDRVVPALEGSTRAVDRLAETRRRDR